MKKRVVSLHHAHEPHMVGDGLPVRNVFSYGDLGKSELSPFLMLDYGSPVEFPATTEVLGVGMHPHRGFETVTLAYQGALEHRDTAGNHGEIGPGDVQWMTAGRGVLHEELHAKNFRDTGGTLQMAQLWVNLPAQQKMTAPKYQTIVKDSIPTVEVSGGAVKIRVVAGSYNDAHGPAETFTPINLLDVRMTGKSQVTFDLPDGYTTAVVVLDGTIKINAAESSEHSDSKYSGSDGSKAIGAVTLAVLERNGTQFSVSSETDAHLLVLNGEPINEPVVGYGPFVMNSQEQIAQAIQDFRNGRFAASAVSGKQ